MKGNGAIWIEVVVLEIPALILREEVFDSSYDPSGQ